MIFTAFFKQHEKPVNQFGLVDLRGEAWRKLKRAMTPSFSTPRLKKNVSTMNECAEKVFYISSMNIHNIKIKYF